MAGVRIGPSAPFRWLQQALALLRRHPRVIAGAAALLIALALVPSLLQLLLMAVFPGQAQAGWIPALGLLLSLLLYPPAAGGFYRLLHALHSGQAVLPSDVLAPFGDRALSLRLIAVNLLFASLSILVLGGLVQVVGGQELLAFLRALQQLQPGAAMPTPPAGTLPLLAVVLLLAAGLVTAQNFGAAEAAIGRQPPISVVGASLLATARNFAALLLFYLPLAAFGFLATMLVALVAMLAGSMLAVLSPVLALLVVFPLSLLLVLVMYALLFTFFYFGWRELFEAGPDTAPAETHQIAA